MSNKNMFFYSTGGISPYLANLVAYWKFDANSNDFSGNGHNGTDTSISYSNAGKVGNSATFSGGTNRVTISQSTDFDFSSGGLDIPFSLSFWVYTTNSSSTQWVISKRDGTTAQWQIAIAANNMYFSIFTNPSNYLTCRTNTPIANNTWVNFCITYDGSKTLGGMNVYENGLITGNSKSTTGTYTGMPIASQPVLIGNENFSGSYIIGLNGKLDEIYIWKNRELTSSDALDIYNNGNSGLTLI